MPPLHVAEHMPQLPQSRKNGHSMVLQVIAWLVGPLMHVPSPTW